MPVIPRFIGMFHRVRGVKPLKGYKLHVSFTNNEERIYDVNPLFVKWDSFNSLKQVENLFNQVKVDNGGYGISWNDSLDLACDELYYNGIPTNS
jgi:hypothetical protein